jgi:myo-inositol 2-dehydrogenase/D-chiro-inositol 1-dehydrogenase/scyllo-inositol 2-dehydrogenase (NAD+)
MALSVEECREINAAVEHAGVRLQLGFMRRFDEGFLEAKALLDSAEMGRVTMIRSTGRGPGLPPPWIFDVRKSNGVLAEVNSHDLDAVRWLAGSSIRRVYAEAANFKCGDVSGEYPDFYDTVVVSLRLADGALGVVDGACPCGYGYDARMEILCANGVIFIGETDRRTTTKVSVEGEITRQTVRSWRNRFREAYLAEIEHFVECVSGGREPCVTGADGLRAVEAVVAANRSLATGGPVEIDHDDRA